jgi:hypothetical protein
LVEYRTEHTTPPQGFFLILSVFDVL